METIYYKNHEYPEVSSTLSLHKESYDCIQKLCEDYAGIDFNFESMGDGKIKIDIIGDEDLIINYWKKVRKYPEIKEWIKI